MVSETPDIVAFKSPIKLEVLTEGQLQTLKDATLSLLQDVGVHFPSQKALETFADHGAQVDWETEIVRISPDLVEKAMSTAGPGDGDDEPRAAFLRVGRARRPIRPYIRWEPNIPGNRWMWCAGAGSGITDRTTITQGRHRPDGESL